MAQFKLSNVLGGFVIFAMLVGCLVGAYQGIETKYRIIRSDTVNNSNVLERIADIDMITGINESVTSIYQVIKPATPLDVVGGLMSAGYGIAQTMLGTLTFPAQIISVIGDHYYISPIIYTPIIVLFYIFAGFIIFNIITRSDN